MDHPNDLNLRHRYDPRDWRSDGRLYHQPARAEEAQPRPLVAAAPSPAQEPSAPSPFLGLLMLALAGLVAFVIVNGGIPSPSPGPDPRPNPNPDVVIDDPAGKAEIAGMVEDRLKADIFDEMADETLAGKYKSDKDWGDEVRKRLEAARAKAHVPIHQALNDYFPADGKLTNPAEFAELQRELAKGFRRSGK